MGRFGVERTQRCRVVEHQAIEKATKLKEKELYAAFGWLGREGKLNITEVEGEIVVALNK